MAYQCRACLISCIDYRLHEQLSRFIAERNLLADGIDFVRVAGVVKNLVRPNEPMERAFLLKQIETSIRLHSIEELYLVNHEDCGAYGLELVPDSDEEIAVHAEDLRAARALLEKTFPTITVGTFFLWLDGRADEIS